MKNWSLAWLGCALAGAVETTTDSSIRRAAVDHRAGDIKTNRLDFSAHIHGQSLD